MAIDLATGFNIGSKDAIDERQVLTLEQMKNLDESIYPDKYFAICKDDGKLYLYDASNEINDETGKFRVLEGSGTADLTGYKKIYTSLSELGLDSADSLYDIMAKMERGEMFLGSTSEYNSSWFPKYEYGIFRIIKGKEVNYSDTTVEWLSSQYGEYAIANLGENSLEEWIFIRRSEEKSFYRSSYSLNEWNLLAKIKFSSSDLNKKHILSFSCSNKIFSKFNSCDLCKYELHFTIPDSECKLTEFGLVLYEYPMPEGTDDGLKNLSKNIGLYYDEDNLCIYIFIINTTDVNYLEGRYIADSLNYFSLEYTGTGVIINSFGAANQGVTWDERWGSLCAFEDLEYPTIVPIGGESSSAEGATIYTSLTELGLTAPVSVGDIFNAMPNNTMAVLACEAKDETEGTVNISDIPVSFGVLTIKKNETGRFSIDYQNSLASTPCNVKRWIGTLKGTDGTGLIWKQISVEPTFVTLTDIGLTASATFQDVVDTLPKGGSAILGVTEFTNYQTIFPYEEGNDQFARVHIVKGTEDGSRMYARWFRKDGVKEAIAKFNINNNLFEGWQIQRSQQTYTELVQLGLTADATVDDVLSKLQPGETFTSGVTQFTNYQTLFPYESSNDQYSRVFIQQGTSLATAYVKWFRKDGSREALAKIDSNNKVVGWNEHTMNEIIHTSLNESLSGITTTLDLINALITEYRAKSKPVRFISGSLTKTTLTDFPANYGVLDITVAGYDLVEVRFAESSYGFKKMYYGYLNRTSSETLFSSLIWMEVNTSTKTLVTNTTTLKLDVTKKNAGWYGAIKLTYLYDTSPAEIEISFRSATDDLRWAVINGQKYVKQITFTQDSGNTSHYTIGIEFSGTTYGCYQAEVIGNFADINSLTSEAFTGAKTAVYYSPWGKNNGVTLVSAPEDLGLTFPCTSVQLAQAMRDKFNKTINAGAIGIFNCGGKTLTITDAPSNYGLMHVETFGHDRILIRFDGIGSSCYDGSWIGQIKGSNGTFSSITWSRNDNNYSETEQVVGTWIDGSTVYRTTIAYTFSDGAYQGNSLITIGNVSGCKLLVKMEGVVRISNYDFKPIPYYTSSSSYANLNFSAYSGNVSFTGSALSEAAQIFVTMEYTKS